MLQYVLMPLVRFFLILVNSKIIGVDLTIIMKVTIYIKHG